MTKAMDIRVKVDDKRAIEAFQKAPDAMRRHVGDGVQRGALEIARSARAKAPKAFSTLVNAINAMKVADLHWRVDAETNYAEAVEGGRAPGRQPGTSKGLMEWVRFRTGKTDSDLERTTFLIARSIGRHGTRPQPFMQPAAEESESRVVALIRESAHRGALEIMR